MFDRCIAQLGTVEFTDSEPALETLEEVVSDVHGGIRYLNRAFYSLHCSLYNMIPFSLHGRARDSVIAFSSWISCLPEALEYVQAAARVLLPLRICRASWNPDHYAC